MWKKYNYAIGVMSTSYLKKQFEHFFQPGLEKIPAISFYARTRGWPFVIAWGHRIAGVLLTLYVLLHIYTLSFLVTPGSYDAEMKVYGFFLFSFLEWLLALPVIFHALNGGRLISYRNLWEHAVTGLILMWVFGLAVIYVLLLALLMILGTQSVTPVFFWLIASILSLCLVVLVTSRIWQIKGLRIVETAAYLRCLFIHHDSGASFVYASTTCRGSRCWGSNCENAAHLY